jgi:hypothetical protein
VLTIASLNFSIDSTEAVLKSGRHGACRVTLAIPNIDVRTIAAWYRIPAAAVHGTSVTSVIALSRGLICGAR